MCLHFYDLCAFFVQNAKIKNVKGEGMSSGAPHLSTLQSGG
jgi:hypothetical protein